MKHRFAPTGHLALAPQAFGVFLDAPQRAEVVQRDGVAIVEIRGPLEQRAHWFCDSYEAVRARVAEALASGPKAVVMVLDTPGGVVKGCFELARALREMAAAAEVPLLAYVDGAALSAGYALACAAERIVVPPTGLVGSIGTIEALVDATKQLEMYGLSYKLVASGARKTDGRPEVPTTDEAVQAVQKRVDDFAELFFGLVSEMRGADVEALRALDAGVLHGADAVRAGLADEVATFDQLLAMASGETPAPAGRASEESMDEEEKKARAALQAIVDDEDATDKAKARARAALAAMDGDDDTSAEGDDGDEKPAEEPEKKAKAEGDEPGDQPEKKDDADAKAQAQVQAQAQALGTSDIKALIAAELRSRDEATERAQLLASRPDLDAVTKKLLANAPIADVREYVAQMPRRALKPAATAVVGGARGEGQVDGNGADRLPADEARALDRQMGLDTSAPKIGMEGSKQILPLMTKDQAIEAMAERRKQRKQSRTA